MHVLAIPQWSFGRDRMLLSDFRDVLEALPLAVHACASDIDHNRTVTALSGPLDVVCAAVEKLAELAFPSIDLNRHTGVHPRLGALDVCPIVPLPSPDIEPTEPELRPALDQLGAALSDRHELPVFFYERSERNRPESELPAMRAGGFGSLLGRKLRPDFGPAEAHPRLGVSMIGVRDFVLAVNVNFQHDSGRVARDLAAHVRDLRKEGDERFLGVRAMAMVLDSRQMTQVSLNLTMPDRTPLDPIVDHLIIEASRHGVTYAGADLVGAIRDRDVTGAQHLSIKPAVVVGGFA